MILEMSVQMSLLFSHHSISVYLVPAFVRITLKASSMQLVPLQPIIISILFHHYKELLECKREIEELEQEGGILQLKHNNHNGG
jgi:hypothetical protein